MRATNAVEMSTAIIAAIIAAASAAIKTEPHLRERVPGPLKAHWWGYVPLVLLAYRSRGLSNQLVWWAAEFCQAFDE
jgi:hypothetical protein